jgi:hypothetical protein
MSYNITLNSSNLVGLNNNTFQYNFIQGAVVFPEDSTISVSQITIPYSWRNITASLGNNTYQYVMPTGSGTGTTTYGPYTIPDGFYTITDLNNLIQAQFKTNGHYWYLYTATLGTANNTYVYPLSLSTTTSLYTNTITAYNIPITNSNTATLFGTGYVIADGSNGTTAWTGVYPTGGTSPYTGRCAQLTFLGTQTPKTTLLGNIVGFTPASYPTTATGLTTLTSSSSGNTLTGVPPYPPLATQVNGVIVRCNLVENNVVSPSDVLDSFPITTTYGSNINYLPISINMVKLKTGRFSNLTISFSDQSFNPLLCLDPNVLITLVINFP